MVFNFLAHLNHKRYENLMKENAHLREQLRISSMSRSKADKTRCMIMPQRGGVNMPLIERKLGVESGVFTKRQTRRAILLVLRNIFDTYVDKYAYSECSNGSIIFVYTQRFASFSVRVKGMSVMYIIETRTAMGERGTFELWFSDKHMTYQTESLLNRLLYDFSEMLSRVSQMQYDCDSRGDTTPNGTYCSNGSLFCNEQEDDLLKPRHYYDGVAGDHGEFVANDWASWLWEIFDKKNGENSAQS